MRARVFPWVAGAAFLASCGGGGGGSGTAVPRKAPLAPATVVVKIPGATVSANAATRRLQQVVAQTAGIIVTVTPDGASPLVSGASLAAGAPNCSANSDGSRSCNVAISAPAGHATIAVATYDAAPTGSTANGNPLANGVTDATFVAGQATAVAVTLNGIAASLKLALAPDTIAMGTAGSTTLNVSAFDADGNLIVAPGGYANPISFSATGVGTAVTFNPATLTTPGGAVTVNYDGTNVALTGSISASASGVPTTAINTVTLKFSAPGLEYLPGETRTYNVTTQRAVARGSAPPFAPSTSTSSYTVSVSGNASFNGQSGLLDMHSNDGPSFVVGPTPPPSFATSFISRSSDRYLNPVPSNGRLQLRRLGGNYTTNNTRFTFAQQNIFTAAGIGLQLPFVSGDSYAWPLDQTNHYVQTATPGTTDYYSYVGDDVLVGGTSTQTYTYPATFADPSFARSQERYFENPDGSATYTWIPLTNAGGPPYQIQVTAPNASHQATLTLAALATPPPGMATPAPGPYAYPLPSATPVTVTYPSNVTQTTASANVSVAGGGTLDALCPFTFTPTYTRTEAFVEIDPAFGIDSTTTTTHYGLTGVGDVCSIARSTAIGYANGFYGGDLQGYSPFYTPSPSNTTTTTTTVTTSMTSQTFAAATARRKAALSPFAALPIAEPERVPLGTILTERRAAGARRIDGARR